MPRPRTKFPGTRTTGAPKPLNERELKFVNAYFRGATLKDAAIEAGYPESRAAVDGCELMRDPRIRELITANQSDLRKKGEYTLEAAMKELDDVIDFAKETGNANAYAKAVELRLKGHGLLIEKHQHMGMAPFTIQISGIDGPKKEISVETTSVALPQQTLPMLELPTNQDTEIAPSETESKEEETLAVEVKVDDDLLA